MKYAWIVILGNVSDGLTLIGPFRTHEFAMDWAEINKEDYTVAKLEEPF